MKDIHTAPDEHLEARITAWVLGEASPFEAAELETLCAADPELQLFLNRIKALHSLLLETPPSSSDQFWKLSPENRAKLDPIIGPNNSTYSNKDFSIRRAAFRSTFGIAAILLLTLFINRFYVQRKIIREPVRSISFSASGGEGGVVMSNDVWDEKMKERSSGILLNEIKQKAFKSPENKRVFAEAPKSFYSISETMSRKEDTASSSLSAAPSAKKSEPLISDVTKSGIGSATGYARGANGTDMSNVAPALDSLGVIEMDELASNDSRSRGGFEYKGKELEQDSLKEREGRLHAQAEAGEKFKSEITNTTIPGIPGDTFAARAIGTPPTPGLRSGDYSVQHESIDAILNNPNRTAQDEIAILPAAEGESPVGGQSFSGGTLAQREIIRREQSIKEGDDAFINGRDAYAKGDYTQAVDKYKQAIAVLPDTPAQADRRESYSQHLSDASVAQAQQMRKVGKYDEARKLLEQAETLSPADATIKNELAYLNDPIRTNPAGTYEHVEKVDQVRRDLYKAQGNYDLGKYDDAKKSYEDILRVDPHNQAARRGMEKVADTKSDYYRAAYGHTRAELLMDVDKAWELTVPAEGVKNGDPFADNKVTDNGYFRAAYSNTRSSLLEADLAENKKNNSAPADAVGYLNLIEDESNFNLALRAGSERGEISVIREFQYPTEYEVPKIPGGAGDKSAASDPFAALAQTDKDSVASELDLYVGQSDPFAAKPAEFEGFANNGSPIDAKPKQIKITTKHVEIAQGNNTELGFGWFNRDENQKADISVNREFQYSNDSTTYLGTTTTSSGTLNIPVTPATPLAFESRLTDTEGETLPILGDIPVIGRLFQSKPPSLTDLSEELSASQEVFSTFSLNISDASFQLASAAIAKGERPDPASIKPEQFYNAVDYGDPAPSASEPVAAAIDQTAHPVIPGRNLVRVAVRTASAGRSAAQPLRLTLLVDQSGSMVRADRRAAMETALTSLATLLTENDQVTVIGFSRTPHLLAKSLPGNEAGKLPDIINQTASEGGTNLEQAINLATEQALSHQLAGAQNRIVLFTDGAANLGDADPERLSKKIQDLRQQGLAFDIAGIGTNELNDRLLSDLARHGNGRYYLVGEKTGGNLAAQLAGAFRPAAENVKVQVKLNPQRVGNYKLIGFEKDRLKTEDFRNDTVDAAELAADEAGVALYQVETLPDGTGEIGEVSVRFRDTASGEMVERKWTIPYDASAPSFDKANPKTQLATLALLAAQKLQPGPLADAIDFSNYSETIAKLKQANANSNKTQQLLNLINNLK